MLVIVVMQPASSTQYYPMRSRFAGRSQKSFGANIVGGYRASRLRMSADAARRIEVQQPVSDRTRGRRDGRERRVVGASVCRDLRIGRQMSQDPLALLPPHRQAMAIKTLLCSREGLGAADALPGLSRYRTPDGHQEGCRRSAATPVFSARRLSTKVVHRRSSRMRLDESCIRSSSITSDQCANRAVSDTDTSSIMITFLDWCVVSSAECATPGSTTAYTRTPNVCLYAGYLNAPPAERLALRYPASHRVRAMDEVRRAILGFDIMKSSAWPSGNPADWRWEIPDAAYLERVTSEWWARHPNTLGARRLST